jgi:hypothetical protein
MVLAAVMGASTPAVASYSSTVNVRDYCTIVDGSTDNTVCIQSAINSLTSFGGIVFFPCGNYKTTASIILPAGLISLQGSGRCTSWGAYGAFDTIRANVGGSSYWLGNGISRIYFAEFNKTSGYTLNLDHMHQLTLDDLTVDGPPAGIFLHDFNNASMSNITINNVSAANSAAIYLTGGGTGDPNGRADGLNMDGILVSSSSSALGTRHGIVIDGSVFTLNGRKVLLTHVDGHALWLRNSVGAAHAPQFVDIYDLESEFSSGAAVYAEAGSVYHFSDAQLHGAMSQSNVVVLANVSRVSFNGGFSSGAKYAGFDLFGQQIAVSNMDITENSTPNSGGIAGAWSGLVVEPSARLLTITSNKAASPDNPGWQKYGIEVRSGADQYAITGNVVRFNAAPGIAGASGTSSQVIANNAF